MISLSEMSHIIYDTLFDNTQYEIFDYDEVTPIYSLYGGDPNYDEYDIPTQEVDPRAGIIRFGYKGTEFEIKIREIK